MTLATLVINDGSGIINLLGNFQLQSWMPSTPQLKNSGVFGDSPFLNGRTLQFGRYTNVTDTFVLTRKGASLDAHIVQLRRLRRLLLKAERYWTSDFNESMVWIEARGACESNSRYAIIVTGRVPDDPSPYATNPLGGNAIEGLPLVIEHLPWQSHKPGSYADTAISNYGSYNGVPLGIIDGVTGLPKYIVGQIARVSNHSKAANLSHIFSFNSGAFWSGNQVYGPPFANTSLFTPPAPLAGDAVYFGIDTSLGNSGPFSSLVFNFITNATTSSFTWEYWNGAAWAALTLQSDNTDPGTGTLRSSGSIHWIPPSAWATTAVNGVTGYWVRARCTVGGDSPIETEWPVYTLSWPYMEWTGTSTSGDLPSKFAIAIGGRGSAGTLVSNRVIMALRTRDRGSNFTPYVNVADEQNAAGITVACVDAAFANDVTSPTGRVALHTPAATGSESTLADISFSGSIATNYVGAFRVFVRAYQTGGSANQMYLRGISKLGVTDDGIYIGEAAYISKTGVWFLADLGVWRSSLSHIFTGVQTEAASPTILRLRVYTTSLVPTLKISDVILMPCDEWYADYIAQSSSSFITWDASSGPTWLNIYTLTTRRLESQAYLGRGFFPTTTWLAAWNAQEAIPLQCTPRVNQRIWFLFAQRPTTFDTGLTWASHPAQAHAVIIKNIDQYMSMRGAL